LRQNHDADALAVSKIGSAAAYAAALRAQLAERAMEVPLLAWLRELPKVVERRASSTPVWPIAPRWRTRLR